jgi:hypothetical protein
VIVDSNWRGSRISSERELRLRFRGDPSRRVVREPTEGFFHDENQPVASFIMVVP